MLGHTASGGHKHTDLVLEVGGWARGLEPVPVKNHTSENTKNKGEGPIVDFGAIHTVRIYRPLLVVSRCGEGSTIVIGENEVVLYECETWSVTLREERRLRVFENRVLKKIFGPKRDEVAGDWRKLHNKGGT